MLDRLGMRQTVSASDTVLDPAVRFAGVTKTYDGGTNFAVRSLDLDVREGEFLTLLGPSGSGKTTTLMMLAGFEDPTGGEIYVGGQPVTALPPHKRGIGVVFQSYALFPHMTVAENLAFPLSVRGLRRAETAERIKRALAMVELSGLDGRRPAQLSGGQQQRVAVARALVFEPKLVLMDEPLGALDKRLRDQMQVELKALQRRLGITVIYVTHDQIEALSMSDRIAVFNQGAVQQLGSPDQIYRRPASLFIAGFMGENNRLPGVVCGSTEAGRVTIRLVGGTEISAATDATFQPGERAVVCVRPEAFVVAADKGHNALVDEVMLLGDQTRLRLICEALSREPITIKVPARSRGQAFAMGDAISIAFDPSDALAFAETTR